MKSRGFLLYSQNQLGISKIVPLICVIRTFSRLAKFATRVAMLYVVYNSAAVMTSRTNDGHKVDLC